jgi:hypothetical protein
MFECFTVALQLISTSFELFCHVGVGAVGFVGVVESWCLRMRWQL